MRKSLLGLLCIATITLSAQTSRSKNVNAPKANYATILSPKGIDSYYAAFANTEKSVLPFSESQFQSSLNFQSLNRIENSDETPGLFFVLNGVKPEDLTTFVNRSKAEELYKVDVYPREQANINVLIMAKGEPTHYFEIPVTAKYNNEAQKVPTTLTFSFEEEAKYLTIVGDMAKITPYFVQEYLNVHFGENVLLDKIVNQLYDSYDIRTDKANQQFYFIKNKNDVETTNASKAKVEELEKLLANIKSIQELRAIKTNLEEFKTYWSSLLENYNLNEKEGKKMGWGLLMNLHKIAVLQEDFGSARKYINQALGLEEKKGITKNAKRSFDQLLKMYSLNYNQSNGERKYASAYIVDQQLLAIAGQKTSSTNKRDIEKLEGHVVLSNGDKISGKISLSFTAEEPANDGMMSLNGDVTGKRVKVYYLNKKGKQKVTSYKCKEIKEIVVDERIFEAVNPKKSVITTDGALGLSLNNTVFMERLYKHGTLKLFKDLIGETEYYFKLKGKKKHKRQMLNILKSVQQ